MGLFIKVGSGNLGIGSSIVSSSSMMQDEQTIFYVIISWNHLKNLIKYTDICTGEWPIDNSLILHIYIIIRKHYCTYFELVHAFYSWFWNNTK